jgi:hypothetical protein
METHSIPATDINENGEMSAPVSMETNTCKLELPILDESLIHPIVEIVESAAPSSSPKPSPSPSPPDNTTEMVTIIVKDFSYCQEEFLKQIKENDVSITPESIMRLLRIAMLIVEQTNQTGNKKKEFVVNLLKEVVTNTDSISPEHRTEALKMISGNIISDSIDFLIDASKGKFDINKVEQIAEEVAKSCFTMCMERFSKKR